MPKVNWYYESSDDTVGVTEWILCDDCAQDMRDAGGRGSLAFNEPGEPDDECELCGEENDED